MPLKARLLLPLMLAALPGSGEKRASCETPERTHAALARLLEAHVSKGKVDYPGLVKERAALDTYVRRLEHSCASDFAALSRADRLAFLINAYNAAVLQAVVHAYPVTSIQKLDAGKPFEVPRIGLGALLARKPAKVSLDELETAIRAFGDPRVHFALVCAAKSCPPLSGTPYLGRTLEAQLEARTRLFMGSDAAVRRTEPGTWALSPLFDWYSADFGGPDAVARFIQRYRQDVSEDALGAKRSYLPWDWELNERER